MKARKNKKHRLGNFTGRQAYKQLINNDLDWYIVQYTDGSFDCTHRTGLSSILECGADPADYDISELYQCWNGQALGECPW